MITFFLFLLLVLVLLFVRVTFRCRHRWASVSRRYVRRGGQWQELPPVPGLVYCPKCRSVAVEDPK